MDTITSINPSTGKVLGEVTVSTEKEIQDKVVNARKAKVAWKEMGVRARVKLLTNVYKVLQQHKNEIGKLDSEEMGFPITQSMDFNLADAFDYFKWNLENAEKYLSPEVTHEDKTSVSTIYHEPRGVVAIIQPWNFPFCQWSWSVIPNLLAGNCVIYKPSEEVLLTGKLLEKIMSECDLPEGALNFVYGAGSVGESLVKQDIDMIVFTGSTKTGEKLYKIAAEKFIRVLLELGGSAPGIVFEDADIDTSLDTIFWQRFTNCGQTCDGLKRLLVQESIFDEVVKKLEKKVSSIKVGDPANKDTVIGPLVAERQVVLLEEQVKDAIEKGAKVVTGGKRVASTKGSFYEPTMLINLSKDMRVWQEEVFGPVLPIATFNTTEKAIRMANDTKYGLGAYVYTTDKKRALRVAGELESGMISVNGSNYVLPTNPFGGYKHSGMGREHGKFGFHEVTQIKLIAINK